MFLRTILIPRKKLHKVLSGFRVNQYNSGGKTSVRQKTVQTWEYSLITGTSGMP